MVLSLNHSSHLKAFLLNTVSRPNRLRATEGTKGDTAGFPSTEVPTPISSASLANLVRAVNLVQEELSV